MLVYCNVNNDHQNFDDFFKKIVNEFHSIPIFISDSCLNLADFFKNLKADIKINCNDSFISVNFNGNMKDFIKYLKNVFDIDLHIDVYNNQLCINVFDNKKMYENDYNLVDNENIFDIFNEYINLNKNCIYLNDVFSCIFKNNKNIKYIFKYNPMININFNGNVNDFFLYLNNNFGISVNIIRKNDLLVVVVDDLKTMLNDLYEQSVFIAEESISLCDLFQKINLNLPVKYVFDYNPMVGVNFSGKMKDFLTYLHDNLNIHQEFKIVNGQLLITFSYCMVFKSYFVNHIESSTSLFDLVSSYGDVMSKITDLNWFITTSCKKHKYIRKIIDEYNSSLAYVNIEFATIDLYIIEKDNYDDLIINGVKDILFIFNRTNIARTINAVVNQISCLLENKKGYCKVTSNLSFMVIDNSFNKFEIALQDISRLITHKNQKELNYDKEKDYLKLNMISHCDRGSNYINLTINLDSKSELSNTRASVNSSTINVRVPNGQVFYLFDRNSGSVFEETSRFWFSSKRKYSVRTIVLLKATIVENVNEKN